MKIIVKKVMWLIFLVSKMDKVGKKDKKTKKDELIQYILYSSQNNKEFSVAVEEWQVTNIINHTHDHPGCVCHNKTFYYYQLINKLNLGTMDICSPCLKYFKHVKPFADILLKQYQYNAKGKEGQFRMCHQCLKFAINVKEESWKVVCRNCWMAGHKVPPSIPLLNHKVCEDCFVSCIDPTSYRTNCYQCYKKFKASQPIDK